MVVLGKSGHAHDRASNDYNHLGTHVQGNVAYVEFETLGRSISLGVGRETILSLSNADREVGYTQLLDLLRIMAWADSLSVTLPAPYRRNATSSIFSRTGSSSL